jgi:hypothetical protein
MQSPPSSPTVVPDRESGTLPTKQIHDVVQPRPAAASTIPCPLVEEESGERTQAHVAPPVAFQDELAKDHQNFVASLLLLKRIAEADPWAPAERAGRRSHEPSLELVRARVCELEDLQATLAGIGPHARDPRMQELVVRHAPLAIFLKGVYTWADWTMEALQELALSTYAGRADMEKLRARVAEAAHFYFDGLVPRIREAVRHVPIYRWEEHEPLRGLSDDLEELFWTSSYAFQKLQRACALEARARRTLEPAPSDLG